MRTQREHHETPFTSAEEAWFWFINCEKAKSEGAKPISGLGDVLRPCAPDDIYMVVLRLRQWDELTNSHIMVLQIFGRYGFRPDPKVHKENLAYMHKKRGEYGRDEKFAAKMWDEAMAVLEPELIKKGIVA